MRGARPRSSNASAGSDATRHLRAADDHRDRSSISDLKREVFGPVLHVLRYRREDLDRLIDDINATGYGLTFGLHTRTRRDHRACHLAGARPGNLYVNRNIIGAVVGVQPFGGVAFPAPAPRPAARSISAAETRAGLFEQIAAVLATGNRGALEGMALPQGLPPRIAAVFAAVPGTRPASALVEGDPTALAERMAALDGPIVSVLARGEAGYPLDLLLEEVSISINTTAAGGNASLMTIG
jgi:delta 1-pyrroline-5-carboxylate dehydrogenase